VPVWRVFIFVQKDGKSKAVTVGSAQRRVLVTRPNYSKQPQMWIAFTLDTETGNSNIQF